MRDHKNNNQDDSIDTYISQCLKNWAARQHLPSNSRARLLLSAASPHVPVAKPSSPLTDDMVYRLGADKYLTSDRVSAHSDHPWLWVLQLSLNPIRHVT